MPSPQDYYNEPSQDFEEDYDLHFLLPQDIDICTEDVEKYKRGGFHPVHLGDRFDGGRYRIVHKLGAGGFSTVWLARDESDKKWVALKIITARHSWSVGDKSAMSAQATSGLLASGTYVVGHQRQFTFEGPNGHHLCLVLPVLGPPASTLSNGFTSRLRPWLARRAAYEATKAVAELHSQGLCHGDVTTANILFCLEDFDRLGEDDIYHLFGRPKTGELETQSGETAGPEAPRYIVEALDFMSSPFNIISHDIKLIDFDQCFPVQSPPKEMLGIPPENLAPEVAVGQPAGPPSDIWALGCCIFRLRSGEGPFENHFDVTSPVDLMRYIVKTLGDMPPEWQDILWDDEGQPTKDPNKGHAFWKSEGAKPLKEMVYKIWDEPEGRAIQTGAVRPNLERGKRGHEEEHEPFPPCFVDMVWKPSAVSIDDVYLYSYNEEYLELLEECPKIQNREAALLYDLMSKIFVYDPKSRLTARELLCHPWFHIEGL